MIKKIWEFGRVLSDVPLSLEQKFNGYGKNRFKINISPQNLFLFIGLIYGIAFLFVVPPFQVLDENSHFLRALGLNEGYLTSEKVYDKSGVYVPEGTWKLVKSFYPFYPELTSYFKEKLKIDDVISKNNITLDKNKKYFADLSRSAVVVYSPVPYLVPAFAINIGEFFNLPPLILFYLARFANLIFWVFLVYLAIRIVPIYKWVFLTLALMPMTIFEAASLSADNLTIALSFLLIAYVLKLALENNIFTKKDFIIMFILSLLLASTKSIYILLFISFLLIPADKFKTHKKKYGIFFSIFILISLVSIGWILLSKDLYVPDVSNWSIIGQTYFVLHNPLTYLVIISQTLMKYGNRFLIMFVGELGNSYISIPYIFVLIYLLSLFFVALVDKTKYYITSRQKMIFLMVSIFTIIFIMTFEYLTWNPVGYNIIHGVQGRYFIPLAPILLLLLYNNRENVLILGKNLPLKINKHYMLIMLGIIVFMLSFSLFLIIGRFYF